MAGRRPLLEVRRLVKHFGGVRAVDGVSLSVSPGQTVGLIGPNGSGKTTMFNLIGGLLRPDSGEVLFDGRRITGLSPERIAELGIARTFQNGRVFGNMTVRENLLIGMHTRVRAARPLARLQHLPGLRWASLLAETAVALARPGRLRQEERESEAEVRRQLSRFGDRLLPRLDAPALSLSYANRRRTEIARGLTMGPRLLLLDEPTAGMNPTETDEVLDQIRALRAEGFSIVLIEHKLNLVMAVSDHVLVLDNGTVLAAGAPAAVQADERVIGAYLGRGLRRRPAGVGRRPAGAGGREGPALSSDSDRSGVRVPAVPHPLLQIEGIDAFYGPVQALANISLMVNRGEIVCLLGGNASGKSTTMKVILGLLLPRAGRVLVDGQDVTMQPTAERIRRGLASVPEARRVFPDMTVEENLLMGGYLSRASADVRDDMDRMFEIFPRLKERRRQAAGTLSGGEQQMLALARGLMSRPALICMDEPTMGLAPIFVERVLETIGAINQRGTSVFMVEQNAILALSIAHRGYVLQNGRLVLAGHARELLGNPAVQEAYLGQRPAGLPGSGASPERS